MEKRRNDNGERAYIRSINDIPMQTIEWLWDKVIPIGKLTVFGGDPGVGRSTFGYYIAAKLSIGEAIYEKETAVSDTLILSAEDEISDTIRPRLEVLNADLKRIHFIQDRIANDGRKNFSIKDIETISDGIDQIKAKGGNLRLVIIDPLGSYLGGTDTNRNNAVREAFDSLLKLAAGERFAILCLAHLNKTRTSSIYRIAGSIALAAIPRGMYILAKDPYDSDKRVLFTVKNNLARDDIGFQYSIQQTNENIPYIQIEKQISDSIGDYLFQNITNKRKISPEQEEILSLLEEAYPKTMCTHELAERLQKKDNNISMMLSKLEKKEKVEKKGTGQWLIKRDTTISVNSAILMGDKYEKNANTDTNEINEISESNE